MPGLTTTAAGVPMRNLGIRIPEILYRRLRMMAAEEGVNLSVFVRIVMDQFLRARIQGATLFHGENPFLVISPVQFDSNGVQQPPTVDFQHWADQDEPMESVEGEPIEPVQD